MLNIDKAIESIDHLLLSFGIPLRPMTSYEMDEDAMDVPVISEAVLRQKLKPVIDDARDYFFEEVETAVMQGQRLSSMYPDMSEVVDTAYDSIIEVLQFKGVDCNNRELQSWAFGRAVLFSDKIAANIKTSTLSPLFDSYIKEYNLNDNQDDNQVIMFKEKKKRSLKADKDLEDYIKKIDEMEKEEVPATEEGWAERESRGYKIGSKHVVESLASEYDEVGDLIFDSEEGKKIVQKASEDVNAVFNSKAARRLEDIISSSVDTIGKAGPLPEDLFILDAVKTYEKNKPIPPDLLKSIAVLMKRRNVALYIESVKDSLKQGIKIDKKGNPQGVFPQLSSQVLEQQIPDEAVLTHFDYVIKRAKARGGTYSIADLYPYYVNYLSYSNKEITEAAKQAANDYKMHTFGKLLSLENKIKTSPSFYIGSLFPPEMREHLSSKEIEDIFKDGRKTAELVDYVKKSSPSLFKTSKEAQKKIPELLKVVMEYRAKVYKEVQEGLEDIKATILANTPTSDQFRYAYLDYEHFDLSDPNWSGTSMVSDKFWEKREKYLERLTKEGQQLKGELENLQIKVWKPGTVTQNIKGEGKLSAGKYIDVDVHEYLDLKDYDNWIEKGGFDSKLDIPYIVARERQRLLTDYEKKIYDVRAVTQEELAERLRLEKGGKPKKFKSSTFAGRDLETLTPEERKIYNYEKEAYDAMQIKEGQVKQVKKEILDEMRNLGMVDRTIGVEDLELDYKAVDRKALEDANSIVGRMKERMDYGGLRKAEKIVNKHGVVAAGEIIPVNRERVFYAYPPRINKKLVGAAELQRLGIEENNLRKMSDNVQAAEIMTSDEFVGAFGSKGKFSPSEADAAQHEYVKERLNTIEAKKIQIETLREKIRNVTRELPLDEETGKILSPHPVLSSDVTTLENKLWLDKDFKNIYDTLSGKKIIDPGKAVLNLEGPALFIPNQEYSQKIQTEWEILRTKKLAMGEHPNIAYDMFNRLKVDLLVPEISMPYATEELKSDLRKRSRQINKQIALMDRAIRGDYEIKKVKNAMGEIEEKLITTKSSIMDEKISNISSQLQILYKEKKQWEAKNFHNLPDDHLLKTEYNNTIRAINQYDAQLNKLSKGEAEMESLLKAYREIKTDLDFQINKISKAEKAKHSGRGLSILEDVSTPRRVSVGGKPLISERLITLEQILLNEDEVRDQLFEESTSLNKKGAEYTNKAVLARKGFIDDLKTRVSNAGGTLTGFSQDVMFRDIYLPAEQLKTGKDFDTIERMFRTFMRVNSNRFAKKGTQNVVSTMFGELIKDTYLQNVFDNIFAPGLEKNIVDISFYNNRLMEQLDPELRKLVAAAEHRRYEFTMNGKKVVSEVTSDAIPDIMAVASEHTGKETGFINKVSSAISEFGSLPQAEKALGISGTVAGVIGVGALVAAGLGIWEAWKHPRDREGRFARKYTGSSSGGISQAYLNKKDEVHYDQRHYPVSSIRKQR